MSTMAWYPLPHQSQSGGGTALPGDEFFFDDQQNAAGWPLWGFGSPADDGHGDRGDDKDAGSSGDGGQAEEVLPATTQQRTQPTDDIFMSQLSDEEVRRMDDAPFEALDMFPGSMHRLLSYENMLTGVLAGGTPPEPEEDATLGVDSMDTCGFPLFSHDLMMQNAAPSEAPLPDLVTPKDHHQDRARSFVTTKRSRPVEDEGSVSLGALEVLQELQDVVFKTLTKRTRVCFRDAFFRLAESSRANTCSSAAEKAGTEGNACRVSTPGPGCPERETNAIDRTVLDLTMRPPRPVPDEVLVSRCAAADGSGTAEAQSATTSTWTTTTAA